MIMEAYSVSAWIKPVSPATGRCLDQWIRSYPEHSVAKSKSLGVKFTGEGRQPMRMDSP